MPPEMRTWITRIGTVGHVARAVVFALIGWFLLKAAYEFDANEAVGLDGALDEDPEGDLRPWLLGVVSAGLIAFGVYSVSERATEPRSRLAAEVRLTMTETTGATPRRRTACSKLWRKRRQPRQRRETRSPSTGARCCTSSARLLSDRLNSTRATG